VRLNRHTVDYRVRVLKWPKELAVTLPPGAVTRLSTTVAERVWAELEGRALPVRVSELQDALADLAPGVLNQTLSREAKRGTVRRVGVGRYLLTERGQQRLNDARAWKSLASEIEDDGWTPQPWTHPYRRSA